MQVHLVLLCIIYPISLQVRERFSDPNYPSYFRGIKLTGFPKVPQVTPQALLQDTSTLNVSTNLNTFTYEHLYGVRHGNTLMSRYYSEKIFD